MEKYTSIYIRTGASQLGIRGQKADLKRWIVTQGSKKVGMVKWFQDTTVGIKKDRPGWAKLQDAINNGRVRQLVVWRLDRIGLTARGLGEFIESLQSKKIRLISLKDSFDSGTASGRLVVNMLSSLAAYEVELRGDRIRAGQASAMAKGKRWGGSKRGRLHKVTNEQVKAIVSMKAKGEKISVIARTFNLSRSTIYRTLDRYEDGLITIKRR